MRDKVVNPIKDEVIRLYVEGVSAASLSRRFNVSRQSVYNWIRSSGTVLLHPEHSSVQRYKSWSPAQETPLSGRYTYMDKQKKKENPADSSLKREIALLKSRLEAAEKRADMAELKAHAYDVMIDIAEKELGVSIRKKSGAKQ